MVRPPEPGRIQGSGTVNRPAHAKRGKWTLAPRDEKLSEHSEQYSDRKIIIRPVEQCSTRKHVTPLERPYIKRLTRYPVFDMTDPMVRLLVNDCGGQGRVLEVLEEILDGRDLQSYDVSDIMRALRTGLYKMYTRVLHMPVEETRALTRAILTHQHPHADLCIPGTNTTPEQFASPGLVRFVEQSVSGMRHLSAPYMWIWCMR